MGRTAPRAALLWAAIAMLTTWAGASGTVRAGPAGLAVDHAPTLSVGAVPPVSMPARRRSLALGPTDPVDARALFDWAQWKLPAVFPGSGTDSQIDAGGTRFTVRGWSNGNFLGVSGDGRVYGIGPVTQNQLVGLGALGDFDALVRADRCQVYPGSCGPVPRIGSWSGRTGDGQARVINLSIDTGGVKGAFVELCAGSVSGTRNPASPIDAEGRFTFSLNAFTNGSTVTVTGVVGTDGNASGTVTMPGCGGAPVPWSAQWRSERSDIPTPIAEIVGPISFDLAVGEPAVLNGRVRPDSVAQGGTQTLQWSFGARPAGSSATLGSGAQVTFVGDAQGSYQARLQASNGVLTGPSAIVALTVGRPTAQIGGVPTGFGPMTLGQPFTLDATRSTDRDGDVLSYRWVLLSRPAGSRAEIVNPNSPRASLTPDRGEFGDSYLVQLEVSDGRSTSSATSFLASSERRLIAPLADAGGDQQAVVGRLVTLDGSRSASIDGAALTYAWTFEQRPAGSAAALQNAGTPTASFTPDVAGDYRIKLNVKDGIGFPSGGDARATISTVTGNARPVAVPGADRSVSVGTRVVLDGSASRDANGDGLRPRWSLLHRPQGSNAALTDATGNAPALTLDVAGPYVVQLIVNDGTRDSLPMTMVLTAR